MKSSEYHKWPLEPKNLHISPSHTLRLWDRFKQIQHNSLPAEAGRGERESCSCTMRERGQNPKVVPVLLESRRGRRRLPNQRSRPEYGTTKVSMINQGCSRGPLKPHWSDSRGRDNGDRNVLLPNFVTSCPRKSGIVSLHEQMRLGKSTVDSPQPWMRYTHN